MYNLYGSHPIQNTSNWGSGPEVLVLWAIGGIKSGIFPKKYGVFNEKIIGKYGYGSIPIDTIFSGMNIHLPAILMFTRGTRVLTHPHMSPRILTVISVRSKWGHSNLPVKWKLNGLLIQIIGTGFYLNNSTINSTWSCSTWSCSSKYSWIYYSLRGYIPTFFGAIPMVTSSSVTKSTPETWG